MVSGLVREAAKAASSFVLATLVVVVVRDPVEQRLVPGVIRLLSLQQALFIYADPSAEPDDRYDFYVPRELLGSGRMIQDQIAAKADRGEDAPRDFKIKGQRAGELYAFTYETSSEKPGNGAFAGVRLAGPRNDDFIVGVLTGLAHERDNDQRCKVQTFLAIIGPAQEKDRFSEVLNGAIARKSISDKLGRETLKTALSNQAVEIDCKESKTAIASFPSLAGVAR
jgi:hypothetical protein